jgi:hypothetical protein
MMGTPIMVAASVRATPRGMTAIPFPSGFGCLPGQPEFRFSRKRAAFSAKAHSLGLKQFRGALGSQRDSWLHIAGILAAAGAELPVDPTSR